MFDRRVLLVLAVILTLGMTYAGRIADLASLVVPGLLVWLAAMFLWLLHEGGWQLLTPRLTRHLVALRWQRSRKGWAQAPSTRRLVTRLTKSAGLTLSPRDKDEPARLARLLDRLARVNLNAPSALRKGLGEGALVEALFPAGPDPASQGYPDLIRKHWPKEPLRRGPFAWVRRGLSWLFYGPGMATVTRTFQVGDLGLILLTISKEKAEANPNYPAFFVTMLARGLLRDSGLPDHPDHLRDLPLHRQRYLVGALRLWTGGPLAAAYTQAVNPCTWAMLQKMTEERRAHEKARARHAEAEARVKAEADTRQVAATADLTAEDVDALLDRIALPAIHLARAWPISAARPGKSWLGGRPCLPAHIDWPLGRGGRLPLHFLAQIDCAEVPRPSALPRDGRLLFFADIDEEMLLEDNGGWAVIHVPAAEATETPRPPPDDLPEINHRDGESRSAHRPPFRREFPCWPVQARAVTDYDVDRDAHASRRDVRQAANARLQADLGLRAAPYRDASIVETRSEADATGKRHSVHRLNRAALGADYLRSWAVVDSLAQALADETRYQVTRAELDLKYARDDAQRQAKAAALTRARALAGEVTAFAGLGDGQDPAARPPAAVTQAMDDWLSGLAATSPRLVEGSLDAAFRSVAQRAVIDPALRGALAYRPLRRALRALRPRETGSHHLMLGAAQRITNETAMGGTRLLCLDSDMGVDFMFCDMGVIEFWIDPADLAAGRFDRVRAATAGG